MPASASEKASGTFLALRRHARSLLTALLIACAPGFVGLCLGAKWASVALPLQILAFWGAIRSVGALIRPVCTAVARPDLPAKLQAAKLLVLAALFIPLTSLYAIEGACIAVVGAGCFSMPIGLILTATVSGARPTEYLRVLFAPALSFAVTLGGAFAVSLA